MKVLRCFGKDCRMIGFFQLHPMNITSLQDQAITMPSRFIACCLNGLMIAGIRGSAQECQLLKARAYVSGIHLSNYIQRELILYKLRSFVPIIFFWLGLKVFRSNISIEQHLMEQTQFSYNPLMMGFKQRVTDWLL